MSSVIYPNLKRSRDPDHDHLEAVILWLILDMAYKCRKLEDSSFSHFRGIKEEAKRKNRSNLGAIGVTQGSSAMSPFPERVRLPIRVS